MVLGWFTGSKTASVDDLVAARKYKQAIELLRQQFKDGNRDVRLRLQLADVLVLSGRGKEAVPILTGVAEEYAREGFAAKAIAVLKKVQKIAPGKPDVERRMAELLHRKMGAASASEAPVIRMPPPRPPDASSPELGVEELGMELGAEGGELGIGFEAPVSTPAPIPAPAVPAPAARPTSPVAAAPAPAVPAAAPPRSAPVPPPPAPVEPTAVELPTDDEFFGLLDDFIEGTVEEEAPAAVVAPAPAQNALFAAFSEGELQAVIHRFQLLSFAPGDIVVSEGQPGHSLFVLTTGHLRAFVRDAAGRSIAVRELPEGSFFGEVSILTGQPRTATITCASPCELLELDRAALDEIVAQYPRVRDLIRATYEARSGSLEEKTAREGGQRPAPKP